MGACEFLIMFIIAGVWIFQVSSNSQWGNGRNRMMMGWMYKFTLFFMPYSNSHVLKVHGTYYCTFCAMCLVTESKQTPFIYIIQGLLYRWTVHLADFPFLNSDWGRKKGPQITPPGFIFWIMIFYNLKKFRSRSIYWGVKLYFEFSRSWSMRCANAGMFWQITGNYRF